MNVLTNHSSEVVCLFCVFFFLSLSLFGSYGLKLSGIRTASRLFFSSRYSLAVPPSTRSCVVEMCIVWMNMESVLISEETNENVGIRIIEGKGAEPDETGQAAFSAWARDPFTSNVRNCAGKFFFQTQEKRMKRTLEQILSLQKEGS